MNPESKYDLSVGISKASSVGFIEPLYFRDFNIQTKIPLSAAKSCTFTAFHEITRQIVSKQN